MYPMRITCRVHLALRYSLILLNTTYKNYRITNTNATVLIGVICLELVTGLSELKSVSWLRRLVAAYHCGDPGSRPVSPFKICGGQWQ
jgi:hypothetical protein